MLRALVICAALLPGAVMAQENCKYFGKNGQSVSPETDFFGGNPYITIFGTDGSETHCSMGPGPAETMRTYDCHDGFVGDIFLVPKSPTATFPEIIILPPHIYYWSCSQAG